MGNCSDAIDSKLEELLEINQYGSSTNSSPVHSRAGSNASAKSSHSEPTEEKTKHLKISKLRKINLNTIPEDTLEDIQSPFLFTRKL